MHSTTHRGYVQLLNRPRVCGGGYAQQGVTNGASEGSGVWDEQQSFRLFVDPVNTRPAMDAHFESMSRMFREGEGPRDFAARAPDFIAAKAREILLLTSDADAFDVLELLRLYIFGLTLDGVRTAPAEGVAGTLDVVGALLAGRGHRLPSGESQSANPGAHTPAIHEAATHILAAHGWLMDSRAESAPHGPLSGLAAHFVQLQLTVRARNYQHVADPIEAMVFGKFADALRTHVGFAYSDVIAVRDATNAEVSERLASSIRCMQDLTLKSEANGLTFSEYRELEVATDEFLVHPGQRAMMDAETIASRARLSLEVTKAVLDAFSLDFASEDVGTRLLDQHLDGSDVVRGKHLVRHNGSYLLFSTPIGTDSLSELLERHLKAVGGKTWERFQRHRSSVCEKETVRHLKRLVSRRTSQSNLKYFRPNPDAALEALGRECDDPGDFGAPAETDALFLVEDVALCVEAKARSVSDGARSGHVKRLTRDLEDIVGEGVSQAIRIEQLIETNGGLWLEDRTWLDLSHVKEIRSIVVSLDDIAPLAAAADQLVRAGVITGDRFPWVTSLHDLAVIGDILGRPAEFLLYLRRRTERAVALKYTTLDELDMLMAFLTGDLTTPTDPRALHHKYPHIDAPTGEEIERYQFDTSPAFIGTYTDPLDAWQSQFETRVENPPPKPSFRASARVLKIVDFLLAENKPGWFRFSADLLNLTPLEQRALDAAVDQMLEATRADGKLHSLCFGRPNPWGFPLLVAVTCPNRKLLHAARDQLEKYALAKATQLGADRALGIMFSEWGAIISLRYLNDASEPGFDTAQAIAELHLKDTRTQQALLPPSARRPTRRLRGKRR